MRIFASLLTAVSVAVLAIIGCSSSSTPSTTQAQTTTVNVSLSDPAACQAPDGPFSHVYVTVTDVKASVNADAPDNDPSFQDLTPQLASAPKQIDLLGQANNQCFLAMLGSTQELQAGNYQQIRIILAPDSAASSIANNPCGTYANCVVLDDGSVHDLALSSESKTGIKIPSGQIANGQFTVGAGQTEDLDIDFNTCSSIVQEGNGTYRLKPVLHAGEVATTSTSINGTIVSSATSQPLVGGGVIVALEQKDATGVDRILMTTMADSSGGFVFCPVPSGSFDIVAVGVDGAGISYSAGVETGISPGETAGMIPLKLSTQMATIQGTVTTQTSGPPPAATPADISVSPLQQAGGNGPTVTIPMLPSTTSANAGSLSTAPGGNCATSTDCASYTLTVPGIYPNVGAYSASGATFAQNSASPANYTVDALAFVQQSGGTADCNPSELKTTSTAQSATLSVIPGSSVTAATLAFTGCQ